MTALAMIIGMMPMALGLGEGGEQNAPLGRAVIGGLLLRDRRDAGVRARGVQPAPRARGPRPAPAGARRVSRWRGSSGVWIFLVAALVLGAAIYAQLHGRRGADAALKRATEEAAVPTVAVVYPGASARHRRARAAGHRPRVHRRGDLRARERVPQEAATWTSARG